MGQVIPFRPRRPVEPTIDRESLSPGLRAFFEKLDAACAAGRFDRRSDDSCDPHGIPRPTVAP